MARYYTEIPKENFLSHIKHLMCDESGEPTYDWVYDETKISDIIIKDLSKVQFDFENCTTFQDNDIQDGYLVEYRELSPGFHSFWVSAGGDWEIPINFMLYWGDNRLRAYIPKDGNVWNKKYKTAYGSENDSEKVETLGEFDYDRIDWNEISKMINSQKMIDEVLGHIIKHPKNDEYVLKQPKVPTINTNTVNQSLPKKYYEEEILMLQYRLDSAVRNENYGLAAQLRDEITLIKTTHNI